MFTSKMNMPTAQHNTDVAAAETNKALSPFPLEDYLVLVTSSSVPT